MKRLLLPLLILAMLNSCKPVSDKRDIAVIPKPVKLSVGVGEFVINRKTVIVFPQNDGVESVAGYFNKRYAATSGYRLKLSHKNSGENEIVFEISGNKEYGDEGYSLESDKNKILIKAYKPAGLFYGVQTLLQLLPVEIYGGKVVEDKVWNVPSVKIFDKPSFKWRGMHLDVSRHFFSKEFVKRYIDLIAMHKMNIFHWHLTDDNGWRIEIKKYPALTDICAWRVPRDKWRTAEPVKPGEKPTYGGYYTQDDIREIVRYAAERSVEIIPEIEMPGHSAEVFAAFPELSCTGKRNIVPVVWGDGVFCAGNDSTFVFLENVLDEVAELFPSKYIHIGGDEVNKKYWRKCAKCQKRIRDNNLKDENELQSWFVKKIEKYLNGKGKRLIGWDEILEGGIAPEATVMSWRGVKGGIESAEQGHDVIMCPGSHCYFDHYQADPDFEPEAIGGYLPLKKVYAFNPVPNELSDDKAHFVLGGQGNVWTEFIFTPEHAEYMALPRMTALAEVLWTPKDEQNWNDFQKRLITQFKRFDAMGVNYSKGTFKIDVKVAKRQDGNFRVALEGEQLLPIYYTLDGTVPNQNSPVYSSPFEINKTTVIKSAYLNDDGEVIRKVSEKTVYKHKAVGKEIVLKSPPAKRYFGQGPLSLVDGFTASDNYADGYWLGFQGKDMEAEIDLGEMLPVHSVSETFLQSARVWIFMPEKVSFILLDENRKAVAEKTVTVKSDIKTDKTFIESFKAVFNNVKARYIKVHAYSLIKCPEWHTAAGNNCWIFTDEIAVE